MNKYKFSLAVLCFLTASLNGLVQASPIHYNFTATKSELDHSIFDSISGSFIIDGDAVTDLNLTVGSHSYSINEVATDSFPSHYLLYGTLNGEVMAFGGTNDFWLSASFGPDGYLQFAYTLSDVLDDAYALNSGTITVTPVPAPASSYLFGSGFLGLLIKRRKPKISADRTDNNTHMH